MKRNIKITLACIIVILCSFSTAQAQNLLNNGGFEDGLSDWNASLNGGSDATIQVIQSDFHSGSNAIEIDATLPGETLKDIELAQFGFAVQKDIVYLLTFWAKCDSAGKEAGILFSSSPISTNQPYDSSKVYLSTTWKKYEVVFSSSITESSFQVAFQFGGSIGKVIIDDVSLEQKGTSWYDGAEYRIDRYRKGNFGIKIVDSGGDPVSDSIIIKQTKHEFQWGTAIDLNDRPTGSNYTSPQAITAPADSEIYRIERYAAFLPYKLPSVAGKKYQLTIKMSENYHNAINLRLFDVYIDGTQVIQNLDKFAVAGARYKACDSTVTLTAVDTVIQLEFISSKDNVAIMGIVLADSAGNPILRLNCSPSTIVTHDGNTYISDLAYLNLYASQPNTTNDDYKKAVMLKYCNFGVCGNQFKWSGIEPNKGIINYAPFDNTLGWFNKVGWGMRAHTLLWGGTSSTDYHEMPQWVGQLAPAVMYDTCKMRIVREMTRYKGIIKDYDVLNEPLHATFMQSRVGDSINWNCFKWAREADPDAHLLINEYNIIEYQSDCDNFVSLMNTLISHGAPIDGIGAQSHFGTSIDVPSVKSRIDKLSQFGLPIKITEFDMAAVDMTQQAHANEFAKMMRLSFSHPSIDGFIIWGLFDPGWRATVANLIGTDKVPKLVADTVYQLIHEKWNTNIPEKTDTSGLCYYRGFYGDYDVLVKINDEWQKFKVSCSKENEGQLFVLNTNSAQAVDPQLIKVRNMVPSTIELTFDKKMTDPASSYKNFKVFDTLTNSVQSAILKPGDSTTIVLTVKSAIKQGYYIPVSYFPGSVKSADGGDLQAFGPVLDDSYTTAFVSAVTAKNGKSIAVIFKDSIDLSSVNDADFVLKVDNVITSFADFFLGSNKDTLFLNLANQIISNQPVITISYVPGSLLTADNLGVVAFINKTVTNQVVAPNMLSAATTKDGTSIQVRFSQAINASTISASDFTVNVNSVEYTITSTGLLSTSNKYVEIILDSPVPYGSTVTVSYTPGTLASEDEVPVSAFNTNVTNKVTTGVSEITEADQVLVYPNPVSDYLKIENAGGFNIISISNITGQKIYTEQIPAGGNMEIDARSFGPGIYFISIKNNKETIIQKLIKQ